MAAKRFRRCMGRCSRTSRTCIYWNVWLLCTAATHGFNMLVQFFLGLKNSGIPVTIRELLDLLEGLQQRLAFADVDEFYQLARLSMVKDEKYYDRFDLAFARYFNDLSDLDDIIEAMI